MDWLYPGPLLPACSTLPCSTSGALEFFCSRIFVTLYGGLGRLTPPAVCPGRTRFFAALMNVGNSRADHRHCSKTTEYHDNRPPKREDLKKDRLRIHRVLDFWRRGERSVAAPHYTLAPFFLSPGQRVPNGHTWVVAGAPRDSDNNAHDRTKDKCEKNCSPAANDAHDHTNDKCDKNRSPSTHVMLLPTDQRSRS